MPEFPQNSQIREPEALHICTRKEPYPTSLPIHRRHTSNTIYSWSAISLKYKPSFKGKKTPSPFIAPVWIYVNPSLTVCRPSEKTIKRLKCSNGPV